MYIQTKHNKKHCLINSSGFTLLELMVGIAILVIITSMVLANFKVGNRQADLNMAAHRVASSLREVQSYAMGLKEFDGISPDNGWGIAFEEGTSYYRIFGDLNSPGKLYNLPVEEKYSKLDLGPNIEISDIFWEADSSIHFLYVVYSPPDPSIHIGTANNESNGNLNHSDGDDARIILKNISSGEIKQVVVNKFGLVDVE